MYTRCPHCQTCFRIAEAHIKAAKGRVRCGSCKDVFDATNHLYDNMPEPDPGQIKTRPVFPEGQHEHIDLSTAPEATNTAPKSKNITPDRSNTPDQSPYMESVVGEYSRYNNLDDMGSINIPGNTDFSDSFIKFVNNEYDPDKKIPAPSPPSSRTETQADSPSNDAPRTTFDTTAADSANNPFISAFAQQQEFEGTKPVTNTARSLELEPLEGIAKEKAMPQSTPATKTSEPDVQTNTRTASKPLEVKPERVLSEYEDAFSVKPPTTDIDIKGISDLYSKAQEQMDKPDELPDDPEQLNRDIEALLNDAMSLDDPAPAPPVKKAKIKKEHTSTPNPFLENINFLDTEPEEANDVLTQFEEELQNIEFSNANAASFSLDNDDAIENASDDAISFDEFDAENIEHDVENIVIGSVDPVPGPGLPAKNTLDDLPSAEHELPKALRTSFEYLDTPPRHIGLSIAMGIGILALILVFSGQMVLFRSYQLANQFPSLTPALASLCETVPCRYSGSTDVSQIELLNRNVRTHPKQKNALLISTAFTNKASFDQPYPTIAIKLSDLSGHIVATRYFHPEEYLEGLYNKFLLMESGTPVHVTLAVLDPGDDAINFEFSFI